MEKHIDIGMDNIDINESLEMIYIPKSNQIINEEIKAYEEFIDNQVEKLKYENLKKQLYDDILEKVMNHVRNEVFTSTNIDYSRADKRKRSNIEDKTLLISHLKDEVSFLRQEVCQKNNIINKLLMENPLMRDERNFSYISQNEIVDNHNESEATDVADTQSEIQSQGEKTNIT